MKDGTNELQIPSIKVAELTKELDMIIAFTILDIEIAEGMYEAAA